MRLAPERNNGEPSEPPPPTKAAALKSPPDPGWRRTWKGSFQREMEHTHTPPSLLNPHPPCIAHRRLG